MLILVKTLTWMVGTLIVVVVLALVTNQYIERCEERLVIVGYVWHTVNVCEQWLR